MGNRDSWGFGSGEGHRAHRDSHCSLHADALQNFLVCGTWGIQREAVKFRAWFWLEWSPARPRVEPREKLLHADARPRADDSTLEVD
jgi:hypothetical protein